MTRFRRRPTDVSDGATWHTEDDVRRASTLDERLHHDRAAHERARERIFVPSWQRLPLSAPIRRVAAG